jgi:hypothetical protein
VLLPEPEPEPEQDSGMQVAEVAVWAYCSLCYEEGKNGSEKGRA